MKKFLVEYSDRKKNRIDKILTNFERYPVDSRPNIYFELSLNAETVAVHSLLLGDKVEALKWFQESSKYYYQTVECQRSLTGRCSWEGEKDDCQKALNMAVLAGDQLLVDNCTRQSLEICKELPIKYPFTSPFYYYLTAFAYFLVDKRELAMSTLEMMRTDNKQFGSLLVGLKECLRCLIAEDKSGFVSGLPIFRR